MFALPLLPLPPIDRIARALPRGARMWLDGDPSHPEGRWSFLGAAPVDVRAVAWGDATPLAIFDALGDPPGDAIEGAVYLTSVGGEVWAQDPASCVVSSMVDGARARGVVEFLGSPRELAERCVEKYGK